MHTDMYSSLYVQPCVSGTCPRVGNLYSSIASRMAPLQYLIACLTTAAAKDVCGGAKRGFVDLFFVGMSSTIRPTAKFG